MDWTDIFDDCTTTIAWKIPRQRIRVGQQVTAKGRDGYLRVGYKGKLYPVHRILWEMRNGPIPEGMQIDHINRDRTDNRPENLRLANQVQNSMNASVRKRTKKLPHSTGVKGVSFVRALVEQPYRAQVSCKGKLYRRGFTNLEDATAWVKTTRERLHGEFTRHE